MNLCACDHSLGKEAGDRGRTDRSWTTHSGALKPGEFPLVGFVCFETGSPYVALAVPELFRLTGWPRTQQGTAYFCSPLREIKGVRHDTQLGGSIYPDGVLSCSPGYLTRGSSPASASKYWAYKHVLPHSARDAPFTIIRMKAALGPFPLTESLWRRAILGRGPDF